MGARFEAFDIFRNLAGKLKVKGQENGPTTLDTSELRSVLDVGQGGFMEREISRGANHSPGVNIGGLNSKVFALISPSPSDAGLIVNRDGKDRRVMTADLIVDFEALGYNYLMEVRYFLKADPDETAIFPVMFMRWFPGDYISTHHEFPLTGCGLPGADVRFGDPYYAGYIGQSLGCTWDKVVPAGWAFYVQVSAASLGVAANFPANTIAGPSVSAWAAPSGIQLPR